MVCVEVMCVYDLYVGSWFVCHWSIDEYVINPADCMVGGVIMGVVGAVPACWGGVGARGSGAGAQGVKELSVPFVQGTLSAWVSVRGVEGCVHVSC
jgi:hypothetical protein